MIPWMSLPYHFVARKWCFEINWCETKKIFSKGGRPDKLDENKYEYSIISIFNNPLDAHQGRTKRSFAVTYARTQTFFPP